MKAAILLTSIALFGAIGWSLGEPMGAGLSFLLGLGGALVGLPVGRRVHEWLED